MDRTGEASTSGLPDSDRVLAALKSSGALERLRTAALKALEQDEELRGVVEQAVRRSDVLRHHTGEKVTRSLVTTLQECLPDVSAEALRSLWRVLTEGEVSQEIDEAVRAVLCRMHTEQLQAVSSQQQQ